MDRQPEPHSRLHFTIFLPTSYLYRSRRSLFWGISSAWSCSVQPEQSNICFVLRCEGAENWRLKKRSFVSFIFLFLFTQWGSIDVRRYKDGGAGLVQFWSIRNRSLQCTPSYTVHSYVIRLGLSLLRWIYGSSSLNLICSHPVPFWCSLGTRSSQIPVKFTDWVTPV